jgi:SAM-dependent methyltransferase
MRLLYRRHYHRRLEAAAEWVEDGDSVLDLCCGPPTLYTRHLRRKSVGYCGLDVNPVFIDAIRRAGADGRVCDLRNEAFTERADVVVMLASLYHFLPEPAEVLKRMFAAARKRVILSEPVHNVSTDAPAVFKALARRLTDPGTGAPEHRFDRTSLDDVLRPHRSLLKHAQSIADERERLMVFDVEPVK